MKSNKNRKILIIITSVMLLVIGFKFGSVFIPYVLEVLN